MILIPTIVFTGTNLLLISETPNNSKDDFDLLDLGGKPLIPKNNKTRQDDFDKRIKMERIASFIHLFIGIIILFSSLYFNTKIWGIPVGGAILIIGHIFNRWYDYNRIIRFFILLLLLVLLILFLKFKNQKTNIIK